MKKTRVILISAAFVIILVLALSFAACGKTASSAPAEEKDYAAIIEAARTEDYNTAYAIITAKSGEDATLALNPNNISDAEAKDMIDMCLQFYGLTDNTMCENYALSISMMNVRSYVVGIFKPADGQKDAVLELANNFKQSQITTQEHYLPDQYEVAKNAVVKELASGEIIIVMSEDSDKVAASIESALK